MCNKYNETELDIGNKRKFGKLDKYSEIKHVCQ